MSGNEMAARSTGEGGGGGRGWRGWRRRQKRKEERPEERHKIGSESEETSDKKQELSIHFYINCQFTPVQKCLRAHLNSELLNQFKRWTL